jgi:hypothetical protein
MKQEELVLDVKSWAIRLVRDELAKKLFGLLLAGIVAVAVIFRKVWAPALSVLEWVLLAILLLTYVAIGANYVLRRRGYNRYWYPRARPRYEILREEISYVVGKDHILSYSRRFRVKALEDNIDDFIDQFVWTGGAAGVPLPGVGVTTVEPRLQAGIWTYYTARFPRHLKKGETHEFVVTWPPIKNWLDSSPFVSSSTDLPTRELTFIIDIPTEAIRAAAFGEEMRSIESAFPMNTVDLSFDRGRLQWSPRTKLYRHYRVRWSWAQGADLQRLSAPSS